MEIYTNKPNERRLFVLVCVYDREMVAQIRFGPCTIKWCEKLSAVQMNTACACEFSRHLFPPLPFCFCSACLPALASSVWILLSVSLVMFMWHAVHHRHSSTVTQLKARRSILAAYAGSAEQKKQQNQRRNKNHHFIVSNEHYAHTHKA